MIVHNEYAQNSVEWMQARAGIPTASEFDQLVTPEFKVRTGQMPESYLAKKLAEAWLGGPLMSFQSFDTEQGQLLEERAFSWYELEFGTQIQKVGFITTDDGKVGCSPDGLLKDSGIEIKCPEVHTHVRYLLEGAVPKDYLPQVHGSMFVTGFESWTFMSYRRRLPPLILTVQRDEKIQAAITEALDRFLERLEAGMDKLVRLNGGPPTRPKYQYQPPAPPAQEQVEEVMP